MSKANPTCPRCSLRNIYFRRDGTLHCRACGFDNGGKPIRDKFKQMREGLK